MTDEELIEQLREPCKYEHTYDADKEEAADRIEKLVSENARFRRMMKTMVPLSADGESVFIDGVGDVELDFDGKLSSALDRIDELLQEREEDHAEINLKADFIEATINQLAIADANIRLLTEGIKHCYRTTGDPWTEVELRKLLEDMH